MLTRSLICRLPWFQDAIESGNDWRDSAKRRATAWSVLQALKLGP